LPVEVDYSNAKSLRDVYIDYSCAVMDLLRRKGSRDLPLLRDGGIGVMPNKAGLPSWAPNYPERVKDELYLIFYQENILASLLTEEIPYPMIKDRRILSVAGVALTSLKRLESKQGPTRKNLGAGDLREWCQDYLRRHPKYPTNNKPSLWALFMTVMWLPVLAFDTPTFLLLICFIKTLNFEVPETNHKLPKTTTNTPGTMPAKGIQTQEVVGVGVAIMQSDESNSNNPEMMVMVSPSVSPDFSNLPQSLNERFFEVEYRLECTLDRNHNTVLFETEGGCLGLGPKGSAVGDIICLVDGYEDLVLLRPQSGTGYYQYVGPCLVTGLPGEDDEVKRKLADGRLKVQMFDLV
jgi:hypothetical protein